MNEKFNLALLFGGRGYERDVSISGAEFLLSKVDKEKYKTTLVHITEEGEWQIPLEETDSIAALVKQTCKATAVAPVFIGGRGGLVSRGGFTEISVAFPLLHGDYGEDGIVQGALENARIPFVGQGTKTGALLSDKIYTKIVAEHLGIPTAKWTLGIRDSRIYTKSRAKATAEKAFSYPIFLKPSSLGSSVGASAVLCEEGFDPAYTLAESLGDGRVLLEECLDVKRELECAYFSAFGKELFTNIGEISYTDGFYDYDSKYSGASKASVRTAADITCETRKQILEYSKSLVSYFGIRDLSRIDFFLTQDGRLLFNEINTLPGFTESSLYPRLLEEAGVDTQSLITSLLQNAMERGA